MTAITASSRSTTSATTTSPTAAAMGQVGLEWTVAGFGDFSSRASETDMLMRNSNTGAVRDLRYQQQRHHLCRADGPGRPGMVGRRLWRFLDAAQRDRHADAQQQYRRIRNLRHQQQSDHLGGGRWVRSGWNGRWRVWRFLRQCQRNRHADAQQQYWRIRDLRHQQQSASPRRRRWDRSGWNGRWSASARSTAPARATC